MRARDMSNVYRNMRTFDLESLRSRKVMRLRTLERQRYGYLALQEMRRIDYNVKEIDVELAARQAQLDLL